MRLEPDVSSAALDFATMLVAAMDTKSRKKGTESEIDPAGPSAANCVVLTRPMNAASIKDISVGAA